MLIRVAVALSKKDLRVPHSKVTACEENLAIKLTVISLILKTEFDIACYSNDFDTLLKNLKNIDLLIISFEVLEENRDKLEEMYFINSRYFPILVGSEQGKLCNYLMLRPIEHIDSIADIDPENDNDKIKKVCELFVRMVNDDFLNKKNNDVLYITTRQDSYAIPKDSILYCQSDLKYTVFVTDSGMLVRKLEKLQDVEDKYLWNFVRVHQSFLINPHKVKRIDKTTNEIVLLDNTRIPFSRRYSATVHDMFSS